MTTRDETPTETPVSKFDAFAAEMREEIAKAVNNTFRIIEAQNSQIEINAHINKRLTLLELKHYFGPYLLACVAIMLASAALVK